MATPNVFIGDRPDTPATSYRLLPTGRTAAIAGGLAVLAALAWAYVVRDASAMSDMVHGLGQVGQRMPNEMGVVAFLEMWAVMMAAMMAPAVLPAVLAHQAVLRRRDEGVAPSVAFVVGFLAVWSLVGAAYLIPFLWFRDLTAGAADSWWLPVVAGAVLVLAGAYQFSPWKAHCQQSCCAPVGLVLRHDAGKGTVGGLRTGLAHGFECLGCCWALMAVLLTVGLMNIFWMLGLTLVFVAEKHWPQALLFGRIFGAALIVLGLAAMAWPGVLHTISAAGA